MSGTWNVGGKFLDIHEYLQGYIDGVLNRQLVFPIPRLGLFKNSSVTKLQPEHAISSLAPLLDGVTIVLLS